VCLHFGTPQHSPPVASLTTPLMKLAVCLLEIYAHVQTASACCLKLSMPVLPGISTGPGADTPVSTDQVAVLQWHMACPKDHSARRGCERIVQGTGRHPSASDTQPGHQLYCLRHPALSLAAALRRCLPHCKECTPWDLIDAFFEVWERARCVVIHA
jgi:hypothetical protein